MKLILISAVSINGIIGLDNEIPWHVPEDFKHYKDTTMGHPVIVGLNTYKTLPPKALENRDYLVLCGEGNLVENEKNNVHLFENIIDLDKYLERELHNETVYIAGGAMIYDQFIERCDECLITWINKYIKFNSNQTPKYFPILKLFTIFTENKTTGWLSSKNNIDYEIVNYIKR